MAQVLSNLLNNAAKYTKPGGQIRLAAASEGTEVVFRVRDNGIGIPPEMLSGIFDLFAQVDHSLDHSQGGLGLGLTLVRSLVEMHGGSVQALSEGLSRGSEFIVRLPVLDHTQPLPINLPSWVTPRRTIDDILSTVGAPGRGQRAVSSSSKMVFSASSSSRPRPGQIFTVGSISWIINADGIGELLDPAQIRSAPIVLRPQLQIRSRIRLPRSTSSTARRPLPRYQRRQASNDDLIASIDRVGLKLAIAGSALDTLIQRRPPSDPDLSGAARETPGVTAPLSGVTDALVADQAKGVRPLADQIADQPPPAVNMLHAGRRSKARLQTIQEESLDSESQGSTEITTEATTKLLFLPPFRGGAIFNISVDSPARNGETEEERTAREGRNANRARRRAEAAEQQRDEQRRPIGRNLNNEFIHVDGHDVYTTPSANLAVAANELARLAQTPELAKVTAMLKAAHVQVNEIRQDQKAAFSTTSNRRSITPNRRRGRSADQLRDNQDGSEGHNDDQNRQHDQEVNQDARARLHHLRDARRQINASPFR